MNNIAINLRERNKKVLIAQEHVFNLTSKIHKLVINTFNTIKREGMCKQNITSPCRPIISQIGSCTEQISQCVDYFLIPIVNKQMTNTRDSADFILKIERLRPLAECLMVSYDVTSLYMNMQFTELLKLHTIALTRRLMQSWLRQRRILSTFLDKF